VTEGFGSSSRDLAPGEQVAGYEVQEQIGRGGMAVVYRALDLRLGRQVALKVLAPQLTEDDAFRQRFIRESRAAAGVDHPHIIPVFEAGDADGLLFIAMRYVSHGDVRRLIEAEGRLSPGRAASIATQVASALDAAHAHGLVHRDVKPGNMLLAETATGTDHVYLADFGLSKHSLATSTLTSTGQFLGTLDYVSPEQIQGQPADGRADQYALACTVVEMLSGSPPFKRDESMALLWAQLEAPPPRLTDLRPDLPPGVDAVLSRALSKSPADRYPTCLAFATALRGTVLHWPSELDPAGGRQAESLQAEPLQAGPRQAEPRGQRQGAVPLQPASPGMPASPLQPASNGQPAGRVLDRPGEPGRPRTQRVPEENVPWRGSATELADPRPQPRTPTERARYPQVAATKQEDYRIGTGSPPPGRAAPAGRRQAGRRRSAAPAAVIGLIVVVALAGIGYKLISHPAAAAPATHGHHGQVASPGTPAQTVRAYFSAINSRDYQRAWQLIGAKGGTYQAFVAGFAGTSHDTVTILSTSGDVVTAKLTAAQTNGTVKTYQGTYTVTNGVITATDVQTVSG
jgi:serine/threonine protein kinase